MQPVTGFHVSSVHSIVEDMLQFPSITPYGGSICVLHDFLLNVKIGGCAGAATGARLARTAAWRSFWRHVRWTGILTRVCSGGIAGGADLHAAVQPGACSAEWDFSRGSVRLEVPERIQRSRTKGSRQPPNTRYCGRPTRWGNPFPIGEEYTRTESLAAFRNAFWACELSVTPERVRAELTAFDYLSCWCRPDQECHVDEYIRAIHDGRRPSAI